MCLYPKILRNPKYKPNKKNGGRVPECKDKRTMYVPIGCQKCMECMKQKAGQWRARLGEEILDWKPEERHFITLTFNTESLIKLRAEVEGDPKGYDLDNAIATLATRRFLERWRAKYGKSAKHWFITELGHNGTEHIHIHGIIFASVKIPKRSKATDRLYYEDITAKEIRDVWGYGYTFKGEYVNEATVNYIVKYCMKADAKHRHYKPTVLCSPGIGKRYKTTPAATINKYKKGQTREVYQTNGGGKMNLPMYWRNHIYTEEQREELWIEKLDKEERWVDGSRISIKHGDTTEYARALKTAQNKNQRLGYGNDEINWEQKRYERERREALHKERLGEANSDKGTHDKETQMARQGDRNTDNEIDEARRWLTKILEGPEYKLKHNNYDEE